MTRRAVTVASPENSGSGSPRMPSSVDLPQPDAPVGPRLSEADGQIKVVDRLPVAETGAGAPANRDREAEATGTATAKTYVMDADAL